MMNLIIIIIYGFYIAQLKKNDDQGPGVSILVESLFKGNE